MSLAHTVTMEGHAAAALVASLNSIIADDEDLRAGTIEGETNLFEAIEAALNRVNEIGSLMAGMKLRMDAIKRRHDRMDAQSDRLRAAIATAMEQASVKRIELAEATITLRAVPPKVIVENEADIPSAFWKEPPPVIDKKAILEALKAKQPVPGAVLSNGGTSITVRTV